MKITDIIENDLKSRIDRGVDYPQNVTLNGLAEIYDVSLTPVRTAVNSLIKQHYIVKQPNGRLDINQKKVGCLKTNSAKIVLEPKTDELLLKHILKQSLKGGEVFLREEACAERYGVGRTVIRGIFNSFAARGVLAHVPRCGWKVHSYSHEDMCAFLEIREIMELKALNLAKGNIDLEKIEHFLAKNQLDGKNQLIDDDLHDYFIECAGNAYIKGFFDKQGLYWAALFNYAAPETASVTTMANEHCDILSAVLHNDWGSARKALSQHVRSQEPIISTLIDKIAHGFDEH
jgi:DNA-binding GntR family transcriptional regulator